MPSCFAGSGTGVLNHMESENFSPRISGGSKVTTPSSLIRTPQL